MALIPPITFDGLTNPLTENLIANTFEIQNSSKVQATTTETDTIKLLPGSLANGIEFQDTLRVAANKRIEFLGAALAGEGNINANPVHGLKIKGITNATGSPVANVLSYDPATLSVSYQPGGPTAGFVTAVGAGTNISVDITNPAIPEVSVNISSALDLNNNDITDGKDASFAGDLTANNVTASSTLTVDNINVKQTINFKPSNEFYVSPNGNDSNLGSILRPFQTIQAAINAAEASISPNTIINIQAGNYNESLTISKGNIILSGSLQSDRSIEGVSVSGKITISITDTDNLFNNQCIFSGFFLSGQIEDISTKQHSVIINGMRIEADSALGGQAIYVHPTSTDQRTIVNQCVITQEATMVANDALVDVTVGRLQLTTCDLAVRTLSPCINIGGSALLVRLYESTLESSSASGSATSLIAISSSTTSAHNIAQNTFTIASTTAKADTPALMVTSSVVQTIVLGQCFFSIGGTVAATNVIRFSTAPTLIVLVANNRAVPNTASAIQSGATVAPLVPVGEAIAAGATGATGPTGIAGSNGSEGATGATGPTGIAGSNGSEGATGATGPTGEAGSNGSEGATGATGPTGIAGSNGSEGATGPTGPTGIAGSNGSEGATGPTGPTGEAGSNGSEGATGATGPTGIAGSNGSEGATGATGPTGIAGSNGSEGATGATGPTGIAGSNGSEGATGATGPTGIAGSNGSEGATGATGPTGIAGSNGSEGATGATGPTGIAGSNGLEGATGATGPTGIAGSNGSEGATGATGPTGIAGSNGSEGATGATGPTGIAGSNGLEGATGPTGPTGIAGSNGLEGATGPTVATTTALDTVGFVATANGTEISDLVPTLICSQNIVLTNSYFFNDKVFGLLGNISFVISASRTLLYSAKIGKNGATPADIVGYGYLSDVINITVPVNLISNIASGFQTFSIGDTVRVEIYAQKIGGGSNPTIIQTVPLIQGVYNALTNQNVVLPPSGEISAVSVRAGPQEVSPLNTYTFRNSTTETVDLFTYPSSTLVRTLNTTLIEGETSSPVTAISYYDIVVATEPPPFPTSPITITETNEIPIGIDPAIQYTFINGSMTDSYVVTLYDDGQPPGPVLTEIAPGQQVQAPSAGFEGYTVALGGSPPPPFPTSPITITEPTSEVPIGIDPAIQYTFINGSMTDSYVVTLYDDGQPPGPVLTEIAPGQQVQAPSAGFEGYTVALGGSPPPPPPFPTSPITLTGPTGPTPIGIDQAIQYTFINNSGGTLLVEGYVNGTLFQTLQILDTESDQFFDVGFTGYIAIAP
jgi:hypothetical protein